MMNDLQRDVQILLDRALLGKTIVAFGEDGFGKHGRHDLPQPFRVTQITIHFEEINGGNYVEIILELDGYTASQYGFIFSDQNFLIGVQSLLKDQHIDFSSVCYSDIMLQSEKCVSLFANADSLVN